MPSYGPLTTIAILFVAVTLAFVVNVIYSAFYEAKNMAPEIGVIYDTMQQYSQYITAVVLLLVGMALAALALLLYTQARS
ncbi:MAG: hypothetical protein QXT13_10195 [Pyrobaculum sp.]